MQSLIYSLWVERIHSVNCCAQDRIPRQVNFVFLPGFRMGQQLHWSTRLQLWHPYTEVQIRFHFEYSLQNLVQTENTCRLVNWRPMLHAWVNNSWTSSFRSDAARATGNAVNYSGACAPSAILKFVAVPRLIVHLPHVYSTSLHNVGVL